MLTIRIDFETRSLADISLGSWQYAQHPSMRLVCACAQVEKETGCQKTVSSHRWQFDPDSPTKSVPMPPTLAALWPRATVRAWNVSFEQNIARALGWPEPAAWRCTMATAAAFGLPQSLDKAATYLGLDGKHKDGKAVMKKYCCPTKEGALRPVADMTIEDWANLVDYCMHDVEIDAAVDKRLGDLTADEVAVWRACNAINQRGVGVDRKLCEAALAINAEMVKRAGLQASEASGGEITGELLTNPAAILNWVNGQGVDMESMDAAAIARALRRKDLPIQVKTVLLSRRSASRISLRKFAAILDRTAIDGRLRGQLKYHGAQATGRWKSEGEQTWQRESGVQLQNLPRPQVKDVRGAVTATLRHDLAALEGLAAGDVEKALVSAIRPALVPPPGHLFAVSDYSGIEARVAPWLCLDEKHLRWWRAHDADPAGTPDGYCRLGTEILGRPVTKATENDRAGAKEAWLSGQFGVGHVKYGSRAAEVYGVDFAKIGKTPEEVIGAFRTEFYLVKEMWGRLQKAVLYVLDHHNMRVECERLVFTWEDASLVMRLPSGRRLWYRDAEWRMVEREYQGRKYMAPEITFKDYSDGKPTESYLYGGKILQNATQAVARDLLAHSLVQAEAKGLPVVLHAHDEIVAEVRADHADSLATLETIMRTVPEWAAGLPVAVEGFLTERYAKKPF